MDFALILIDKYPGRQFSVGETYESIVALDGGDIPSKKDLEKAWPEVSRARAIANVEVFRALAYRETSDPIFFEYQRGDKTEAEWLAAVQAVKDANPYPETV